MKKILFPSACAALILSGCGGIPGGSWRDLSIVSPRTFASLPYSGNPEPLCRTPVPRPSLMVVSRTVLSLAGSDGEVEQVSIPTGVAFGIWSDKTRMAGIREYLKQLARERTVHVKVELLRIGKNTPYFVHSFSVATNRPFLAGSWADGKETRVVSAFFVRAGGTVSPVLDLTLLSPGFRSCRTATPDFPGNDILFKAREAIVKKGDTNLELTWETLNGKR